MRDYREAWDRASKIEYETHCRQAEKAQEDKSRLLLPDDPYFVVNTTVYDNRDEFRDLIKYGINPFYNPRIAVPLLFRGGPSVMNLPVPRYRDEQGGHFMSQPEREYRHDPIGIRPGWTVVHFDLAEPLDIQLERAKKRLQQVQKTFLEEVGLGLPDRLKQKSTRRQRKDMWPLYLRVLDGRASGARYEVIGRKLKGIGARIDAKKWHKAALKVANRAA
jgi:hypothetical protein